MTFILNIGNYITLPCHSHRCCLWTSTGAWIGITQLRSRRGIIIFSLLVYVPVLATAFSVFKQNNEWQRQTIMNDWERPVAIICPAAGHDNTAIYDRIISGENIQGEKESLLWRWLPADQWQININMEFYVHIMICKVSILASLMILFAQGYSTHLQLRRFETSL